MGEKSRILGLDLNSVFSLAFGSQVVLEKEPERVESCFEIGNTD
jgi:hypothetical protein